LAARLLMQKTDVPLAVQHTTSPECLRASQSDLLIDKEDGKIIR
jgi:hypothetical protein